MARTDKDDGAGAHSTSPANTSRTSPSTKYHADGEKSSVIETILAKLKNVEAGGDANTWTALCPAHKDRRKGLSITLGDDGRILAKCFSGCSFEKIVGALGMDKSDFAPSSHVRT